MKLLTLVQCAIVELILVIYNEMVCTVSKRNNRSVRETPTEAPGYRNGESKLVGFWCELRDIEVFWVERSDLIECLILCLVFFLILHYLCLQ